MSEVAGVGSKLLTVAELQTRLGLSQMTVYRMMDRKEIPFIRLGRSRRVRESDLEAYLRRQTSGTQ